MTPVVAVVFFTDNDTTLGLCYDALGCGNMKNQMTPVVVVVFFTDNNTTLGLC